MKVNKYLIIFSIIISISCDPCEEIDCANPFSENELGWLPYSEGDNLIFQDFNSTENLKYVVNYSQNSKRTIGDDSSPYCIIACKYIFNVTFNGVFNDHMHEFTFDMINTATSGLSLKVYDGTLGSHGRSLNSLFNLKEAILIDSISINGNYLKNVYKYTTYPMQKTVAETYMHQGIGLVKLKFRNGQEFELVKHIKVSD